jgi:hypothetical protein
MRIGKASDTFQRRPVLKVAILGASGAGKTEWAARSPRPLILLTEPQGLASITNANPDALVVIIETWEDFRRVFDACKAAKIIDIDGQSACEINIDGQTLVYQTLVVDSFTDLQRLAINKLAGVESGIKDRLDFDSGAINMGFEKWGQLTSGCESVWTQQRALPCNTIFLFLAEDKTDDQQVKTTIPMLAGQKLPYSMGQFFNAVGLAMVRKNGDGSLQHAIRWQSPTAAALTKPAPGWPAATLNTRTPGQTTLGSLLLYSYPDLTVAHNDTDSAEYVATKPVALPTPVEEPATPVDSARRRRA